MRKRGLGAVIAVAALSLAAPISAAAAATPELPSSPPPATDAAPVNATADLPVTQLIVKYEPGVAATEAPGVATGDKSVVGVDLEPDPDPPAPRRCKQPVQRVRQPGISQIGRVDLDE